MPITLAADDGVAILGAGEPSLEGLTAADALLVDRLTTFPRLLAVFLVPFQTFRR